jgi:hypothetical protein
MTQRLAFSEVEEAGHAPGPSSDSSAPRLEPESLTLRYRIRSVDDVGLEALRYARRAMLREEWTRGLEEGEPSLEDAVFSVFEILWSVPAGERDRCRAKLSQLLDRANRALEEMSAGERSS